MLDHEGEPPLRISFMNGSYEVADSVRPTTETAEERLVAESPNGRWHLPAAGCSKRRMSAAGREGLFEGK